MAIIAAGSQSYIGYVPEVTWGTTPTTGTFKKARINRHSLELAQATLESAEIRQDRMIVDVRMGRHSVTGDVVVPPTYGDVNDWLQAVLGGTWTTGAVGTPLTCTYGSVVRSFSIEAGYTDIGQYEVFNGCLINSLAISIKGAQMITFTWGIIGRDLGPVVTTPMTSTYTAALAGGVMSSFDGIVQEGGTTIAYMTGLDLTINNGITLPDVIGSKVAPGWFWGRQKITGTMTCLFEDATILSKFQNETESAISFTIKGSPTATNTLTINCPRIKYTKGSTPVQNEQGISLTMPFEALYSTSAGYDIIATQSNANANAAL